jgi:phosphate-selective porin OprO/OprP
VKAAAGSTAPESGSEAAPVKAESDGRRLQFETVDKAFSFQFGGRVQADAVFHDADHTALGDGTEIRRLFLDVRGTIFEDWNYRFQYDFARPSGGDPASRGIRDAWLQYTGLDPLTIKIGSHKEPVGLERLTSNLNLVFMERGLPDLFTPDRHVGISASRYGSTWTASLGLWGERPEGDAAAEGDEGWDAAGRVTLAPFQDDGRVLHFGLSGRRHTPEDSVTELRFRERPESHVTGVRFIDTGVLPDVDRFYSIGGEAAAVFGPFSVQGEYIHTLVERRGAPDPEFGAWYAWASWFLTGESRPYRSKEGTFDRIRPNAVVGQGGNGAWEVAVRYSAADLSDAGITGGEQEDVTVALNWYATPNIRFSANYIRVVDVDRPGHAADGEEANILAFRSQLDF